MTRPDLIFAFSRYAGKQYRDRAGYDDVPVVTISDDSIEAPREGACVVIVGEAKTAAQHAAVLDLHTLRDCGKIEITL